MFELFNSTAASLAVKYRPHRAHNVPDSAGISLEQRAPQSRANVQLSHKPMRSSDYLASQVDHDFLALNLDVEPSQTQVPVREADAGLDVILDSVPRTHKCHFVIRNIIAEPPSIRRQAHPCGRTHFRKRSTFL